MLDPMEKAAKPAEIPTLRLTIAASATTPFRRFQARFRDPRRLDGVEA
jgi:hypothetical protein